eukprot:c22024_g1_i1 orf=477-1013(+)
MGDKGTKGGQNFGCCDMSVQCRCRWHWDSSGPFSFCRDSAQHRTCTLSSVFIFFLGSFLLFGLLGMFFAWLTFSPFEQPFLNLTRRGCQEDNEGSWSVGIFYGSNPFSLRPIELENVQNYKASAWPVANPVLTCGSVSDGSHPSNFVADPFLYIQGSKLYMFFETKNALTKQGDIGVA